MMTIKKIMFALIPTIVFIYTSSVFAHFIDFNKLAKNNSNAPVAVSFQLTKDEILVEYHLRAKYFDIEKWLLNQNDKIYQKQHLHDVIMQDLVQYDQRDSKVTLAVHGMFDPMQKSQNRSQQEQENEISAVDKINIAGIVAVTLCNAHASADVKNNQINLVPKFNAPLSFIKGIKSKKNKNKHYDLEEGINFDCVYSNNSKNIAI